MFSQQKSRSYLILLHVHNAIYGETITCIRIVNKRNIMQLFITKFRLIVGILRQN